MATSEDENLAIDMAWTPRGREHGRVNRPEARCSAVARVGARQASRSHLGLYEIPRAAGLSRRVRAPLLRTAPETS